MPFFAVIRYFSDNQLLCQDCQAVHRRSLTDPHQAQTSRESLPGDSLLDKRKLFRLVNPQVQGIRRA